MAVVSRPPALRRRKRLDDVGLEGGEIQALKLRGVVELRPHWVDLRRVLVEDPQVYLLRPPVLVRQRARRGVRVVEDRAPRSGCHRRGGDINRANVFLSHGAPSLFACLIWLITLARLNRLACFMVSPLNPGALV